MTNNTIMRDLSSLFRNITADDVLDTFGLQRKSSALVSAVPMFGAFIVGAVVGAGVTLLFAPKTGEELRQDLSSRMGDLAEQIKKAVPPMGGKTDESTRPS